jgi:SAM-dependent methyltransferase
MQPELYHAHHNLHREDLSFWLDLAKQSCGPVLELGCGTGRVLLPIARLGQQIVGIDNSLQMLQFTRNTINDIAPEPWLIASDMRRFHLELEYSLIILPCNTFSTLDEPGRQACLECVKRHLSPGGSFAFSIPNPDHLVGLPTCSLPELEDEFIHPTSGNPIQVSSAWQRTSSQFMVTWLYDELLPDGRVERTNETVAHQLIPAAAYIDELRSVGFTVRHLYGDFDRADYHDDSPALIAICYL